jgi:hypothetical protein
MFYGLLIRVFCNLDILHLLPKNRPVVRRFRSNLFVGDDGAGVWDRCVKVVIKSDPSLISVVFRP